MIDHKLIGAANDRLNYASEMRKWGIVVTADGHHIPLAEWNDWCTRGCYAS